MTFDEWVAYGIVSRFCGPPLCETHDGLPLSGDEEAEFELGNDICVPVMRVYEDGDTADAVEDNHSPSVWRKIMWDEGLDYERSKV